MKVAVLILVLAACVVGVEGTGNQTCSTYFNKTICVNRLHQLALNDFPPNSLEKSELFNKFVFNADKNCSSQNCTNVTDLGTCCQVNKCGDDNDDFECGNRGHRLEKQTIENGYSILCPNANCTSDFCCNPDSSSDFQTTIFNIGNNGTTIDVNTTFPIVRGMIVSIVINQTIYEHTVTEAAINSSLGITTVTLTPALPALFSVSEKSAINDEKVWFSPAKAHHHKKKKTTKKETLTANQRIYVIIGAIAGTMVLGAIGYSFVTSGSFKKQSYTPLPSSSSSMI